MTPINVSRQRQFLLGLGLTLSSLYCAAILFAPGVTSNTAAYRVVLQIFHDDNGLGAAFIAVAVLQGAGCVLRGLRVLWVLFGVCCAWWVFLGVAFFLGYAYTIGPGLCLVPAAVNAYMLRFAALDRLGAIPTTRVG